MLRLALVALLAAAPALLADEPQKNKQDEKTDQIKEQIKQMIEQKKAQQGEKSADAKQSDGPRVKLETTLGDIVIELNPERAPITVKNFVDYVTSDFYDNTVFHRVIKTFMIQGGGFTTEMDKKTDGLRPPIKNEWQNGLKNVRGSIAMARMGGNPDSATSQFFINVVDNFRLDQPQRDGAAYCVFGKVVEGMDVVDKIRDAEVKKHPKYPSPQAVTPDPPVVIKSAEMVGDFDREALEKQVQDAIKAAEEAEQQAQQQREKKVQDFIKKTEAELGKEAEKTESGIYYFVLEEGSGDSPKPSDTVEVHYRGTHLNGQEFDSSYKRNQPATFPLNRVIKGWTEGVAMMKVGGKWKFVIPPELAYGETGRPGIPPNSPLVFDVELLDIK